MKDAFWFQHDSNARSDSRILELRAEMGWEGYGLWWALVEQLREATDYQLSNTEMRGLAMGLAITKPEARKFIDLCLEIGLLTLDGDYFHAAALRRRMERWDTKRSALSEAGKRGAGKRWAGDKPADAPPKAPPEAPQKPLDSQAIATPLATPIAITEQDIREEKSTEQTLPSVGGAGQEEVEPWLTPLPGGPDEGSAHQGGAADVGTSLQPARGGRWAYDPAAIAENLILPFESQEFRQAWIAYRTFREEKGHPQLNGGLQEQEALRHLGLLANQDEAEAIELIKYNIRGGWKTLYKPDAKRQSNPQQHAFGQSANGAKPTGAAVDIAASLVARRFEQRANGAGATGQATGAHPGGGAAVPPGIRPNP